MDNIFWLLIFAGATIGLLSTFLIASERELKVKRRRVQELESKLAEAPEGGLTETAAGNNSQDATRIKELTAQNQELLEEISALTHKLGASERKVEELQAIYARLSEVDADNAELRSASQQLQQENRELQSRLAASESRINEGEGTGREIFDSSGQLQGEIAALKRQLEKSQARVHELEASEQRLANATVLESSWKDQQVELETQILRLKDEIIVSEAKTREMAALQNRLNETELRYQQSSEEKARLEEQIVRWQERLAESEESRRCLEIIRTRLEELQARQSALAENNRQIQDEMLALGNLLQGSPGNMQQLDLPSSNRPTESLLDALSPNDSAPNPLRSTGGSIETARQYIEAGRYQEALSQLESRLQLEPNDRETQLYHLLVSVKLHGTDGYGMQINSIQDMADLTESERVAARDIFLLRADEAQKRGRDDEMLRYRLWARNVVFRTPFGNQETKTAPRGNGTDKANGHTPALQLGEQKTSPVVPLPSATADELSAQASRKRKRFGFFVVVLVIFLAAAAMKAGFLRSDPLDRNPVHAPKLETQLDTVTAKRGMAQRSLENRLADARAEPTQKAVANSVAATKSLPTKSKDEKEAKTK